MHYFEAVGTVSLFLSVLLLFSVTIIGLIGSFDMILIKLGIIGIFLGIFGLGVYYVISKYEVDSEL